MKKLAKMNLDQLTKEMPVIPEIEKRGFVGGEGVISSSVKLIKELADGKSIYQYKDKNGVSTNIEVKVSFSKVSLSIEQEFDSFEDLFTNWFSSPDTLQQNLDSIPDGFFTYPPVDTTDTSGIL
jgi:hypothetical protein